MYDNYKNKNISLHSINNFDNKRIVNNYKTDLKFDIYDTDEIKFWIYDPTVLFQKIDICPSEEMTNAERLNSMTRVVIIITLVMFLLKFDLWMVFLLLSLFSIIIVWFFVKGRDELYLDYMYRKKQYIRKPKTTKIDQPLHTKPIKGGDIYGNVKLKLIPKQ